MNAGALAGDTRCILMVQQFQTKISNQAISNQDSLVTVSERHAQSPKSLQQDNTQGKAIWCFAESLYKSYCFTGL